MNIFSFVKNYINDILISNEISELQYKYSRFINCKKNIGSDNIICKYYYNEYTKMIEPYINQRIGILNDPLKQLDKYPWELG